MFVTFDCWREHAAESKALKEKLRGALRRLTNRTLAGAFNAWRDAVYQSYMMQNKAAQVRPP